MLSRMAAVSCRQLELLHVVHGNGGAVAAQRARQLRAHGDRAQRARSPARTAAARDSASRRASLPGVPDSM